jgi:hypothetical protein
MAALTVVKSTNIANAAVGNDEFVFIVVCVTRSGHPRTGLSKQEVTFGDLHVGPGGRGIEWNPAPHAYWESRPRGQGLALFTISA